jgi:hypothetical protein
MSRRPKILQHYRVEADRETGDWLTQPEYLGNVDRDAHLARQDTDAEHYDTHTMGDGCLPETFTTVAITVAWKGGSTVPRRPAPASVAAVASAIGGQPDSRRWRVDGATYSTAEMLAANANAPDVISWISTARAGDSFRGSFLDCTCLG